LGNLVLSRVFSGFCRSYAKLYQDVAYSPGGSTLGNGMSRNVNQCDVYLLVY